MKRCSHDAYGRAEAMTVHSPTKVRGQLLTEALVLALPSLGPIPFRVAALARGALPSFLRALSLAWPRAAAIAPQGYSRLDRLEAVLASLAFILLATVNGPAR